MTTRAGPFSVKDPIVRESVAEMVVRRILDLVKAGVLKAGDPLPPERDLAHMLDVSRPSVREAMRGLTVLGVVRARQGGGTYVSELDAEALLGPIQFFIALERMNIRELYDARSLIESDVARRAAERMETGALDQLERLLAEQRRTVNDVSAFRVSDYAFHELIWIGSDNAFLKRISQSLHVLGLEFRKRASETPGVIEQSLRDHRKLLEALKAHDPDAAAKAAAEHMHNVFQSTVKPASKVRAAT